ncbi:MAG: hypothetical protein FJ303_08590 [Planctomycetes bacterium]|nr:hypothetical protein [Planctomycetota bacterium]
MCRCVCTCSLAFLIAIHAGAASNGPSAKKPTSGVFAVLRESVKEKDVLPLKDGEALLVHRHRYLKAGDKEPPRYVVVRRRPDVTLDLIGEPRAIKQGGEVMGILLTLQPKAAQTLERLTTAHLDKHVAIVLGGEIVTVHRVRTVIKNGDVQITNCTPGAAAYLLEQLKREWK